MYCKRSDILYLSCLLINKFLSLINIVTKEVCMGAVIKGLKKQSVVEPVVQTSKY